MKICIFSRRRYKEVEELEKYFEIVTAKKADICIALGGDGTFIRAARSFSGPILPIRGNDPGSAGYYSDIDVGRIGEACRLLAAGKYRVERISHKLEVIYSGKRFYAINEALLRNDRTNVYFGVSIRQNRKEELAYPFVIGGDGVLVTEAVGSTAYNRAAGGPIIMSPGVMCITLLNPDGPMRSPVIVPSKSTVVVAVYRYSGFLECDGIRIARLSKGSKFSVRVSERGLDIVKLRGLGESTAQKLERLTIEKSMRSI